MKEKIDVHSLKNNCEQYPIYLNVICSFHAYGSFNTLNKKNGHSYMPTLCTLSFLSYHNKRVECGILLNDGLNFDESLESELFHYILSLCLQSVKNQSKFSKLSNRLSFFTILLTKETAIQHLMS